MITLWIKQSLDAFAIKNMIFTMKSKFKNIYPAVRIIKIIHPSTKKFPN